jgi:Domain of unknown function (DUF4062)
MNVPSVFVSSTCYDLSQVRMDLREFIESLGLEPVLSEFSTFPIDPGASNVDNCVGAVRDRATIFVLLLGIRYGSVVQGKSITNREYLTARAKGIPVYTFMTKELLTMLPMWRQNPNGNFAGIVDSPEIFAFAASIYDSGSAWVFPFESAQDIKETLKSQFAILFGKSLADRRLSSMPFSATVQLLSGPALRLVVERPSALGVRLFAHVLADEMHTVRLARFDLEQGVVFGPQKCMNGDEFYEWATLQIISAKELFEVFDRLWEPVLSGTLARSDKDADPDLPIQIFWYMSRRDSWKSTDSSSSGARTATAYAPTTGSFACRSHL